MPQTEPYFSEIAEHLSSFAKADVSKVFPLEHHKRRHLNTLTPFLRNGAKHCRDAP